MLDITRGVLDSTDPSNPTREDTTSDDYLLTDIVPGEQVQVNLFSPDYDPFVQIVNADTGEVIAFDDDSGFGVNSRLSFTAEEGVDYIVRVTSFGSDATGDYTVLTNTGNIVPATPLSDNESVNGALVSSDPDNELRTGSDYDGYLLTDLVTGQQVQVNLDSSEFDPFLQLVNAETGEVLAENDDFNGLNSQLTFTVEEGIDYIVRATSFSSETGGEYTLTTTTTGGGSVLDEPNDTIPQAIESGISAANPTFSDAGAIGDNPNVESGLDVDIIAVQLDAGDQLTIDIDADESGSSLDSVLRVFDANGTELAVSDDTPAPGEEFSLDSYIEFAAPISDTYYVAVSGFSNFGYDPFVEGSGTSGSTGAYNVALTVNSGNVSDGFNSNSELVLA